MPVILVLAAVLPAIAILLIAYLRDPHRERWSALTFLAGLGALVVLPAGLIEQNLLNLYGLTPDPPTGFILTLVTAFFVAGITEEGLKGLVFRRFAWNFSTYDEPYDGVVFAVAIGLGFGVVENLLYVTSYGLSTAFVRAFTALPAHALFGVAMGSYFSEAKFFGRAIYPAFVVPALLHGGYDTFALANSFWANALLVLYLMFLVRFAFARAGKLLYGASLAAHRGS